MKFAKLEELARAMSAQEIEDNFRALTRDPRFAAVVATCLSHKEQFADGGALQQLANNHGALAHNAGSIYALNVLLGKIRGVCDPPKRRGAQAPPPE